MKNLKTMVLVVLLAASLSACKKKDGGGSGDSLGVPECDEYLTRMDACAKKIGDSKGGGQLTKMADMMRKSWKEDVKDAEMKKSMPEGCRSAIRDMAKQNPDCDWGVATAPAAPAAGGGDLPPECAEYKAAIEALSKCEKLPQASRDALKQSYEQTSAAWASVPAEGRAALGTACKSATDAVKQSAAACN
ncbi:MAG: hypothetical protein H0T46_27185 [Deltaproteobacteria bacterium]|nr:hypothetical protein [Deltaproteobacteria bacterium]